MKICFICEGSYPFVVGGVSSWIQMLLKEYERQYEEIKFSVWTIATSEKEMSEYKYDIPSNVVDIKRIYLADRAFVKKHRGMYRVKKGKEILRALIMGDTDEVGWDSILNYLNQYKHELVDILMSEEFFNLAVELYNSKYSRTVFSTFLWNLRSMFFPLVAVLSNEFAEADIYHAVSTGYAGVLGGLASHVHKKPFVLTEHGIYTREREEEIIKSDWVNGAFKEMWIDFFKMLSHIAYQKASKVITLFETNKSIQVELGCPAEKISIVPNGVDMERFKNLPARSYASRQFVNIGVVARVVPIKDIKTMLLAFDIVKQKVPNARLIILGPCDENTEYYKECAELLEELDIDDVYFKGNVNILEYLPHFDMMLLTSISEGQPLAVLEGMAAKIPQICTNVGSCKELLYGKRDDTIGRAGIIVPVMNIQKIADAMIELSTNSRLRLDMGEAGFLRVEKYYRKSVFLSKYYNLYKSMERGDMSWQE